MTTASAFAGGLVLALLGAAAPARAADTCRFIPLRIEPAETAKYAQYAGKGKRVTVELTNDTGKPADTFSEPPLRVRRAGGKACDIDGGNWVRDKIFLSADENYLLTLEFSGSSSELVIYNIVKCHKKSAFNLSGAKWSIDGSALTIGAHCVDDARKNCVPEKTVRLDPQCSPMKRR